MCLGGATELGMVGWLPAYAERTLGYSKSAGALGFAGFQGAMILGRWASALIVHRIGPIRLMVVCCILSIVSYVVCWTSPYAWLGLSGCIAVGLTSSSFWPTMLSVTADRFPRGGATMFAMLAVSGTAGGILAPWLIGAVAGQSELHFGVANGASLRWGLAVATLWPAVMAALLLLMGRRGGKGR